MNVPLDAILAWHHKGKHAAYCNKISNAIFMNINLGSSNISNNYNRFRCDNTIGSYACVRVATCGTGYTLNHNTGMCVDDDECRYIILPGL